MVAGVSARKLKVLQVLPALNGGGVERGTLEIARALVARGHESTVLSQGGRLVAELEREGSRHIALDIGRKSPLTLLQYRSVRKLFTRERFDIVHVRSRLPAWVAYLAWRGMDAQTRPHFVATVHGLHSVSAYSGIMCRGERVIAVSDTVRSHIEKYYAQGSKAAHWPRIDMQHVVTIARGVDPEEFPWQYQPPARWLEEFAAQYPQLAGKFVVTLPGRLTRLKGHHDFIAIIGTLVAMGLDIVGLVVGGEDPKRPAYAQEIRARVVSEGLQERVMFLGHRSDMREIYAVSDCVLSLSGKPEAFGRTVLEALALGRPVLAYAHGGVAEILDALYPFGAVLNGDAKAVAERLVHVLQGSEQGGTPKVIRNEKFLLADMQQRTLAIYEELVS